MGSHDQSKNHTTGHVCHDCGWPFPNPHPSAKQRRAHKKICGFLEGYTLTIKERKTHLHGGKDQLSDEKHKASELVELKRKRTKGFYDAFVEFVTRSAQNPDINVNTDIFQEPEHPMQVSQLKKPQDLESSVDNTRNSVQFQDDTSSSTISSVSVSFDKKTEAFAVDATKPSHDSANLISDVNQVLALTVDATKGGHDYANVISDVKPKELVNVIPEITSTQPPDDLTGKSMIHSGQSSKGQQHGNSAPDETNMVYFTQKQEVIPARRIRGTAVAAVVSPDEIEVDGASNAISSSNFPEKATVSIASGSDGSGTYPEISNDIITGLAQTAFSIEKQERYASQHDLSSMIPPKYPMEIQETGTASMVYPSDTEVDGASIAFSNSEFPKKVTVSTDNRSNGFEALSDSANLPEGPKVIPESDMHAMVYSKYSNVDGASHASSSCDDSPKKPRTGRFDLAGKYVSQGVAEVGGEDLHEGPKGVAVTRCTDSSCIAENGDSNSRVSEPLHEDINVDLDNSRLFGSGAENLRLDEHINPGSWIPSSVAVENNTADDLSGDVTDINSQSLQDDDVHNLKYQPGTPASVLGREFSSTSGGQIDHVEGNPESVSDRLVILSAKDSEKDTLKIKSVSLPNGVDSLIKQHLSLLAVMPPDTSVDSNSQADSLEGHWGSASDRTSSFPRDVNEEGAGIATETLDMEIKDKDDQRANFKRETSASELQHAAHSDIFDVPRFVTLVEPGNREIHQQTLSSEIQTVQNIQQRNSSILQSGWFPLLAHGAKDSAGRKNNKEITDNWVDKSYMRWREVLEAKLGIKRKPPNALGQPLTVANPIYEASSPDRSPPAKASPLVTALETSTVFAGEGDEEKNWKPPARLPVNKKVKRKSKESWIRLPVNKKVKRKTKGSWMPFVCCTSLEWGL